MAYQIMLANFILVGLLFANISALSSLSAKVVGGVKVKIEYNAYSAFITVYEKDNCFVCGASIVNEMVILTAAHCFDEATKSSTVIAAVGHVNNEKGQACKVIRVKVHDDYNKQSIQNDIGLAALRKPLKFGSRVNRVALANNHNPLKGVATVAGWGVIDEQTFQNTKFLHKVKQRIWARQHCLTLIPEIPNGTFCAGELQSNKYPSLGDSGSALIVNGYKQIGIVSYKRMDIASSITIYTDVGYFYGWITRNVKSIICRRNS